MVARASDSIRLSAPNNFRWIFMRSPVRLECGWVIIATTKQSANLLLEPAAAISQPPRRVPDGNGRAQRPPDRQDHIGDQPEHSERDPENLALHTLNCKSFVRRSISDRRTPGNFGFVAETLIGVSGWVIAPGGNTFPSA